MQFESILSVITANCAHVAPVVDENATPKIVIISLHDLKKVCQALYAHTDAYFDMLSCITAIDNGPQSATMEVIYSLYSIPYNHNVGLKVVVRRDEPAIDSVCDIWRTANWHEREAFDMFGIKFNGHPDLRRILMPADWVGCPLRKDYQQEGYYRDIKIEY
ncbi:MAG TPA: NADH-quinone oxidoreductase subunit C [Chryseosolibacter sp.]|nr:NADH-quinone oxidoreductase subunit C [Chryseosolibacter sp.]